MEIWNERVFFPQRVSENRASSCPGLLRSHLPSSLLGRHSSTQPLASSLVRHWGGRAEERETRRKRRLCNEALQVKVSFLNNLLKKFCLTLVRSSLSCLFNCAISQSGWTGCYKGGAVGWPSHGWKVQVSHNHLQEWPTTIQHWPTSPTLPENCSSLCLECPCSYSLPLHLIFKFESTIISIFDF